MENLQPEKKLLSSLEVPSETIEILVEQLKQLHRRDDPNDALGEANKTTGVNDSGNGNTDYLNYTTYAKALVDVAQEIEKPLTPVCIGVYGRWGSGKTKATVLIHEVLKETLPPKDTKSISHFFIDLCWSSRFCWICCFTIKQCCGKALCCHRDESSVDETYLAPSNEDAKLI